MRRNYLPTITVRTAAELLKASSGRIADIACGKGPLQTALAPSNGEMIIGVDQSWSQLADANAAGMSVALGNILVMPFKSSVFDMAVCLNTLYNFSSLEEFHPAIEEMLRIIHDDGKIVIDIRNRRNPVIRIKNWLHNRKELFPTIPYVPEDITGAMNAAGCRLVRQEAVGINNRMLAWGYIMVFEKGAER
jgi:ubiquinone/menaquinone biosynthesis C-methylase UbiE